MQSLRPNPHGTRRCALAALICGLAFVAPLAAQEATGITLTGVATDTADDNRFFTRVGGAVRDDVSYAGLTAGQAYTLKAQLHNMTSGELEGEAVFQTFTPEASQGSVSIELPVPANRTQFNIDHVVVLTLYEGEVDAAGAEAATAVAEAADTANLDQTIQVHAIQSIKVTAADASDGDQALPPEGGRIIATTEHVNLVSGYSYALWGQLLTPSGQSTGIYASVPEYVPAEMNGTVTMEFTVPSGFEGIRLVPVVGLFHKNRVTLNDDGSLTPIPGAPNPIMIASDLSLDAEEQTMAIGVPFEEQAASN